MFFSFKKKGLTTKIHTFCIEIKLALLLAFYVFRSCFLRYECPITHVLSQFFHLFCCKEALQTCFRDKDALHTTILGLTFLTFNYRRQWLKLALLVTIEILFFMSLYNFARTQKSVHLESTTMWFHGALASEILSRDVAQGDVTKATNSRLLRWPTSHPLRLRDVVESERCMKLVLGAFIFQREIRW